MQFCRLQALGLRRSHSSSTHYLNCQHKQVLAHFFPPPLCLSFSRRLKSPCRRCRCCSVQGVLPSQQRSHSQPRLQPAAPRWLRSPCCPWSWSRSQGRTPAMPLPQPAQPQGQTRRPARAKKERRWKGKPGTGTGSGGQPRFSLS